MNDVENGSYLLAKGIWIELNKRKSICHLAKIKDLLSTHLTKTLYAQNRTAVLQLISHKISYKEALINRQNTEFTKSLHKSIASVNEEIETLLALVQSFDAMADLLQTETAQFVEEWYQMKQQNILLAELLDAQTERAETWSTTAFSLHDHILTKKAHAQ